MEGSGTAGANEVIVPLADHLLGAIHVPLSLHARRKIVPEEKSDATGTIASVGGLASKSISAKYETPPDALSPSKRQRGEPITFALIWLLSPEKTGPPDTEMDTEVSPPEKVFLLGH